MLRNSNSRAWIPTEGLQPQFQTYKVLPKPFSISYNQTNPTLIISFQFFSDLPLPLLPPRMSILSHFSSKHLYYSSLSVQTLVHYTLHFSFYWCHSYLSFDHFISHRIQLSTTHIHRINFTSPTITYLPNILRLTTRLI